MQIQELLQQYLTGEPLLDAVIISILFAVFFEFFKILFSAVFKPFNR